MRFSANVLLPVLVGLVSASLDASVYIFPQTESSNHPKLSLEQARLVFAQRLGVSQYHWLRDASESTISYINRFGAQSFQLFEKPVENVGQLVLIVEGVSPKTAQPLLDAMSTAKPAFTITNVPSMATNSRLVADFKAQTKQKSGPDCSLEDEINPFDRSCWNSNSKIIHIDLLADENNVKALVDAQARLRQFAERNELNCAIILMPESSRSSKTLLNAYGSYEKVFSGKRQATKNFLGSKALSKLPIHEGQAPAPSETSKPFKGVPGLCHNSIDSCISSTNNCSGHGECYKKYGDNNNKESCFACGCRATNETVSWAQGTKKGWKISYWGGSACHKKDISSAFWLISTFSIVMIGVVTWGIGLLYSIGEDQLPGVIGAGVSSKQR